MGDFTIKRFFHYAIVSALVSTLNVCNLDAKIKREMETLEKAIKLQHFPNVFSAEFKQIRIL